LTSIFLAAPRLAAEPQTTSSTQQATSAIVPPQLESPPVAPYPAGAHGDAVVIVTVTVNRDGSVRTASAEPNEPFSSAASAAVRGFRFAPATRDGKPVAAVIRLEIAFQAQVTAPAEPAASEAAETNQPRASPSAAKPTERTIQIEVRGAKLAPAVTSLSRGEVRQLPGAFGDPFRAIEALPGVTPIVSGLPFFYVRGAPPGNVGYFLDGVRVPYLYHVGLGPSVVHPALVSRVDLYSGGYPARFGRFAGGIVSGETNDPQFELHGEGNVRLFDAGALVEGGFAHGRGSALLGGRYSYTAAIVSLLAPNTTLAYRDYQARVTYDLTPRDRLTAFGFGAYDLLGQTQNNILNVVFGVEFYRQDLRWEHRFSDHSVLRTGVVLGYDQSRVGDQRNSQDRMLGVRSQLDHRLSERLQFRSGIDATLDSYTADKRTYADPEDPDTLRFNRIFPPRLDQAAGAWADVVWNVDDRIELTPGARVDLFGSGGASAVAVDPRVAARFKITDKLRVVHTYGLSHQPPSFVVPIPGLTPGKLQGGLQSAWQTAAGLELDLPGDIDLRATLFHNAYFKMTDVLGLSSAAGADTAIEQRARGEAEGFELYLHRSLTRQLGGYVSYTLSRSTREVGGYVFPSAFDRTHVGSLALSYDLGKHWRAGGRFVFYTGVPTSNRVPGAAPRTPDPHPPREPSFHRIDVRLEKRWQLGLSKRSWISMVLEVMNATLNKETIGSTAIGPVTIPSIGVEAGF
jgi:TonB family protein